MEEAPRRSRLGVSGAHFSTHSKIHSRIDHTPRNHVWAFVNQLELHSIIFHLRIKEL